MVNWGIDLNKTAKIVVCILIILTAFRCNIKETSIDRAKAAIQQKNISLTEQISAKELNDFIDFWPSYYDYSKANDIYVPFIDSKPSDYIDWKMKLWFTYHKWDANRFFYIYQRLYSILRLIKIKRNARELVKLLEHRNDDISRDMLALQQRIAEETGGFSQSEFLLVAAREKLLNELFKQ
ncbi:MAG: hypothetical protein IJ564_06925 [Alphaproteobacteria bacterium]|nr:hypothetical protein [Alphaproteobacteria bacterium]